MMTNHKMIHACYFWRVVYTTQLKKNDLAFLFLLDITYSLCLCQRHTHVHMSVYVHSCTHVLCLLQVLIHGDHLFSVPNCSLDVPMMLSWQCELFIYEATQDFLFSFFGGVDSPHCSRGEKIGHWAGWWIWAVFTFYERIWVTSSHLTTNHTEANTARLHHFSPGITH